MHMDNETQRDRAPRARRTAWMAGGAGVLILGIGVAFAADHVEAPLTKEVVIADIDDVYAWHDAAQNKLVVAVDIFNDPKDENATTLSLSDDILYGVHIDNDGDNEADIDVWVRFGQDSLGNWGMQVENLPGTSAPVVGPVESIIYTGAGRYVFAGLRDDPFFFDLTGFNETLSTGSVSFDSTNDDFAHRNVISIVLEMDLQASLQSHTSLQLWATTAIRD